MLEKKVKDNIKRIIRKYLNQSHYKVFIFGSWATKTNRRFSDVDVGILGEKRLPGHIIVQIQEELGNSPIPYKVDVVDFQKVSQEFQKVALKKAEYL